MSHRPFSSVIHASEYSGLRMALGRYLRMMSSALAMWSECAWVPR